MRRALLAVGLATLAFPTTASARVAEIGTMADGVRGSCPRNCQAVSRTTGYQAKVGPNRDLYRAPEDGRIVAWTIALGNPGPKQRAFFTERLGGESQAAIVVLDPGARLRHRVVAKAPLVKLNDYFGRAVQFPLARSLPIKRGQSVGLTVPTWVPALQIGLGSDTSWRSARAANDCSDTATQTALVGSRRSASFRCLYRTARLTYRATLVTNPTTDG